MEPSGSSRRILMSRCQGSPLFEGMQQDPPKPDGPHGEKFIQLSKNCSYHVFVDNRNPIIRLEYIWTAFKIFYLFKTLCFVAYCTGIFDHHSPGPHHKRQPTRLFSAWLE